MAALREQGERLRGQITTGRREAVERQHALGKRTARERIDALLDEGSFTEVDMYRRHQSQGLRMGDNRPYTDGVVTGSGTIDGRRVFVYAQDFTISGGSLGEAHAAKIHKVMDLAISTGSPVIGLIDSGGARIQEGVAALAGYGGIFQRSVQASGVIPQISVVRGPCAGGAADTVGLADFAVMVRGTAQR
jgi:acetyl-CoA carboxylase carboxyltransferase component